MARLNEPKPPLSKDYYRSGDMMQSKGLLTRVYVTQHYPYQKLGSPKPRTDFPGVLYSVPMYKFRCLVVLFTAIKTKTKRFWSQPVKSIMMEHLRFGEVEFGERVFLLGGGGGGEAGGGGCKENNERVTNITH